jgi:FG-GAP-like repeat/Bacterial Ig-like domain (group 3)
MTHSPIVAVRRRLNFRQISLGRLVPVLLSALALVTAAPAWALTSTTTTLLTAPDNPNSGAVITLTARVLATEYTVAGGTVSFTDTYNGVSEVLGTVQIQSTNGNAGTAILQTEVGGVGTHQFQAVYSGTSFFATSSSPAQSVPFIIPYASATALTTTGTAPGPYSFTGTVSAFGPSGPTGTVTFTDTTSNFVLGSAPLNPATLQNGFTAPTNYPITGMNNGNTGGTNGPAEGDFNGDGRPDFAVPTNSGPIVILIGKGDGTFSNGTSLTPPLPFEPTAVVVGDYNQDGKQDLAVLSASGPGSIGSVNVYLGNGDGSFQAPKNAPVGTTGPTGSRLLATGDFNRDGVADLVASNSVTNQVAVLLGNGDGSFQAPVLYAVGTSPWNVVVGDINNDGFQDLAVASDGTGSVSVLVGNGDGTFKPYIPFSIGSSQVGSVALGDFNHDGFPDLATTSAPDNSVYVSLNLKTATPSFGTPTKYAMNSGPYYLTIGDFNRDGNPDIISANGNNVGILLGTAGPTGAFSPVTPTYYTLPSSAIFATVGDINGDDRVDITAVTANGLTVLLSGQSESASISNITINGCTTTPQSVVASYGGDSNYGISTSAPQTFTANAQATNLVLTVTPANNFVGQQVTLQATLTPSAYGSTTTNGELVTFKNGATVIGTAPLSSGVAVLNTSFAFATAESFTASYGGDCAFTGKTSNTVAGSTLNPSVLTWNTPAPITYGTPLGSAQLNATDKVAGVPLAGTFTYNPAAGAILTAGTHTLSVTFVPTDPTYATQAATVQLVVNQGVPVIIWPTPTPISYGTPLNGFQLDATATSGTVAVPLPYNVTGIYTPGSTYTPATSFDNDGYSYSTTTLGALTPSTLLWNGLTFNIGPANAPDAVATPTGAAAGLTIPLPAGNFTDLFMLGAMVNNIAASQNFIVTYTDNSTLVFNQSMSDWFNAAGWPGESVINCSEKRNFDDGTTQADSVCVYGYDIPLDVTKTVKSITLPNTRNIVMLSMDLQTPQIPGTFVYNPPSGTIEPVGTDPLQVTFTPTDTVDYTPANATVSLQVVAPATTTTPTISWPTPAPITYGTPLSSTQLDAVAMAQAQPTPVVPTDQLLVVSTATDGTSFGLAGFDGAGNSYSYNELNLGTQATDGQVNYQGTTFTLGQPTVPNAITNGAVYTLAQPGNYSSVYLIGAGVNAVNRAPFLLTYADNPSRPVTQTVNMSAWTRARGSNGGETVVATTDHANTRGGGSNPGTYRLYGYQIAADPTRTLLSVTVPNNRNVVIMALGFGTNNQVVVPGTYVYTPPAGTILSVGTHTLNVAFTPDNTAGYNSATGSTTILVTKATPILNWPTPAAISPGTPLSSIQLNATATFQGATLPGTFNYTVPPSPNPANGQVLSAGTHTLQVVFTPTDTTDFTTVTATVQIVVGTTGATGVGGSSGYPTAECCYFSQPTPYTVTVNGNNAAPTGTITVTFGAQTLATGTLAPVSGSSSSVLLSLNSFYFNPGPNTVTLKYSGDTNYVANSNTASVSLLNPVFGAQTTTVLSTPTTLSVPYTFTQAGTLSYNYSPIGGSITDFKDNGVQCYEGSTPTALANQPLPQGTLCIFSVSFTPQLPGIRKGAIQVDFTPTGLSAQPHLYAFLSGLGAASQISLSSAQTLVLNSGLMQPQGLAFNPNDTANASLYLGNGTYTTSSPNVGQIDKLSGGTLSTWVPASPTTVVYPSNVTFDAFGNLVVTDANAAKVVSFNPSRAATTVGMGSFTLTLPLATGIDFGGNMYIADAGATGRVITIPGETFASYTPSLLNLGASVLFPQGLAIDNAGANLYVADGGTYASPSTTSQVVQVPLSGAGGTAISLSPCDGTVSPCTFNSPAGMAFDPNGDLFITDSGPRVLMVPANHSASNQTTQLPMTGLVNPTGITMDGSGDIYVTDLNGTVDELMVNAGAMKFTAANQILSTTITNTGNLPLKNITITAPTSPFSVSTDGCSGTTVPAGGKCTLSYKYAGSGSAVSDTITITSNAYAANGVTITLHN